MALTTELVDQLLDCLVEFVRRQRLRVRRIDFVNGMPRFGDDFIKLEPVSRLHFHGPFGGSNDLARLVGDYQQLHVSTPSLTSLKVKRPRRLPATSLCSHCLCS